MHFNSATSSKCKHIYIYVELILGSFSCAEWQIYLVLLGLFLASAVAFYIFFQNSDSFWKLPIARDQTGRPKIEAILGDPQSEDQWGAFGPLDM